MKQCLAINWLSLQTRDGWRRMQEEGENLRRITGVETSNESQMCLSSLTLGMPQQPQAQNTTPRFLATFSNSSLTFRGSFSDWSYTSGTLHLLQLRMSPQMHSVPGSKRKNVRCLQHPLPSCQRLWVRRQRSALVSGHNVCQQRIKQHFCSLVDIGDLENFIVISEFQLPYEMQKKKNLSLKH